MQDKGEVAGELVGDPTLSADRPIQTAAGDRLGYQPFAMAVAKGIAFRAPSDPFVLGLEAEWGMGKTSLVNLILSEVESQNDSGDTQHKTHVLRFDPWLFSEVEGLAKAYLAELSKILDANLPENAQPATREFFRKFFSRSSDIAGAAASLGALAAGGAAVPGLAAALGQLAKGGFGLVENALDQKPVDEVLDAVRDDLARLACRLLIVIDDLDRLQPEEIRQILTLVKTFGDLPYVTHLLVYDRTIVDAALSDTQPQPSGRRTPTFLEKIVQLPITLPLPRVGRLKELFSERISLAFGVGTSFDKERFSHLWEEGLSALIRSPRDVVRISNALQVTWPTLAGEADPLDFLSLEAIRVLEPTVYGRLPGLRYILTGIGHFAGFGDEERKLQERRDAVTVGLDKGRAGVLIKILEQVFPKLNQFGGDITYTEMWHRRSPGHVEFFSRYFDFQTMQGVPTSVRDEFLSRRTDEEFVKETLLDQAKDGTLVEFIAELANAIEFEHEREIEKDNRILLKAIFDIGEELVDKPTDEPPAALDYQAFQALAGLTFALAGTISENERVTELVALTEQAKGILFPVTLWHRAAQNVGRLSRPTAGRGEVILQAGEAIETFGQAVHERLLVAGANVRGTPLLGWILGIWIEIGARDEVVTIYRSALPEPTATARIIDSWLGFSTGARSSRSVATWRTLRAGSVPTFLDVSELKLAAEQHLSRPELPKWQRELFSVFVELASGLPDEANDTESLTSSGDPNLGGCIGESVSP